MRHTFEVKSGGDVKETTLFREMIKKMPGIDSIVSCSKTVLSSHLIYMLDHSYFNFVLVLRLSIVMIT